MVLYNIAKAIVKTFDDSQSIKFLDTGAIRPPVPITNLRFPLTEGQQSIAHTKAYDVIDILRIQSKRGNYCPETNNLLVRYSSEYFGFLVEYINMRRDICIAGRVKKEVIGQSKKAKERALMETNPNYKSIAEILSLAENAVNRIHSGRIRYYRIKDELISSLKSYIESVMPCVHPRIQSNDLEIFLAAIDTAKQNKKRATIITGDPHFQHLHEFYLEHQMLRPELDHPETQIKMAKREINKKRRLSVSG